MAQTRGQLRRFDLRARKGLGQHFLIDEEVLKLTTSSAELTATDVVIEVGPGLGVLSRELASRAGRLFTIELDSKLAVILKNDLAHFLNVTVINDDVLNIDPASLLQGGQVGFSPVTDSPLHYKVVANLPYYITSAVLRHFLEASLRPRLMILMMQKEVAQAIVAGPGGMSLLSISVQFYARPEIIEYVPAHCFYPQPKVDSALLKVLSYPEPPAVDRVSFFRLVRAGFTASRKQICNSLARGLGLPKDEVISWLVKVGIAPQRRAETLALDEWVELWRVFTQVERGE
ncbi:MAG: 16S rRNA (adenine(1518)-N(6)/adenine(1519)-N(6))-dimethyltransferase RsmA [Dehalococcoidales bacterium]|nr:16S rRNA (adenine(1518)-N(6)/adenine(1519)-N(6))-dimethyltransferase RsmA [Dehalococcoidales bacterium]